MTSNFEVLAKITSEPPALPPVEHAGAHILNTPNFERKYSKAYLGNPESRDASALRRQIAKGAREALEDQYWDIMERTVQARPMEARLGGDPSISNKVRAFLFVRYYKNGEWEDRIEVYQFHLVI
jgi:nuclear pore complex protein Nup93